MGEALETGDPTLLPEPEVTLRGLAQAMVLLGEHDRALDLLEARVFAMPFMVQYDVWDPILAPIWDTRRFQGVIMPRLRLEGVEPTFAGPPESR